MAPDPELLTLRHGTVEALVLPAEGGVIASISVDGRPVLTRTPWAESVEPSDALAPDESTWVRRWRGGWNLCFPTTGTPDAAAVPREGFHGAASLARWSCDGLRQDRVTLTWHDEAGLSVTRVVSVTADGVMARSHAINHGEERLVAVAEHLILGGDIIGAVGRADDALTLEVPPGTRIAALDYAGLPAGEPEPWPGGYRETWTRVNSLTPPRVAALISPSPSSITVRHAAFEAQIAWSGLEHALLWEEIASSAEPPWNGQVSALGIEPTSTPHGGGSALRSGMRLLAPGESMDWTASLAVQWITGATE